MPSPDDVFRYPMQGLGGRVFRPRRRWLDVREEDDRACWQVVQRRRLLCRTSDVINPAGLVVYTVVQPGLGVFGNRYEIRRGDQVVCRVKAGAAGAEIHADGLPAARYDFGWGLRRTFPVVAKDGRRLATLELPSSWPIRCELSIAEDACQDPVWVLGVALASEELLDRG